MTIFRFGTAALLAGFVLVAATGSGFSQERPCADLGTTDHRILEICTRQAIGGSASAQAMLAFMYKHGKGGASINPTEAFKWCVMADAQGSKESLGCMYEAYDRGEVTSKDLIEAYKYVTLQIEHGCMTCPPGSMGAEQLNSLLRIRTYFNNTLPNDAITEAIRRAAKWDDLHGYKK